MNKKLVVATLVPGIIQASGFIWSLSLPLQIGQYAHAGVELAFICSASALIYGMCAWLRRKVTAPRPRIEAEAQMPIAEKPQQQTSKDCEYFDNLFKDWDPGDMFELPQLVRLRQTLKMLETKIELAERSQQPAEAPAQPATP